MDFILNPIVITTITLVISALLIIAFLLNRYRKCPSDQVLVVFGSFGSSHTEVVKNEKTGKETKITVTKPAKTLNGGGTFVWPVIQDYAMMSLKPFQLKTEFKGKDADNIDVILNVTLTTAIGREQDFMEAAATRILHMNVQEQKNLLEDILDGELRGIVANMPVLDLKNKRDDFIRRTKEQLEPEMNKYGFVLMNLTASDVKDLSKILENKAQEMIEKTNQEALRKIAEQKKEGETAIAEVEKNKAIMLAKTQLEQETQVRETDKTRETQVAEIAKDQAKILEQTKADKEVAIREINKDNILRKAAITKEESVQAANILTERETLIAKANADKEANLREAEADQEIRKAKFESQQVVEVARAHANAELEANAAQFEADASVAEKKNESLAKQREAETVKDTRIAQANAKKDTATAQANAEKDAATSEANADKEIRQSKAEQERDAKKAEFEADRNKRAYIANKEANVTKQQAIAEVAKAEGDAAVAAQDSIRRGNEAKVQAEQLVAKKEQELKLEVNEAAALAKEAELQAATIVPAEIEKKQATIQAEQNKAVKTLQAEAEAVQIEKKAAADANAIKATGTAEAEMIKLKGVAEAEALKAKAMAEVEAAVAKAQGLEASKASAFAKMVEVAGGVDGAIAYAQLEYKAQVDIATAESYSKSLNGLISEKASITLGGSSSDLANYAGSMLGLIPAVQNMAKLGKEVVSQVKSVAKAPASEEFEETK